MKLVYSFIALSLACGLVPSLACGQGALDKTTLGQQQNDARDLANSMVPGEKKYGGKGEKKEQVNAAELKSKSIKDSTFGGSLLNIGIDPAVPKLDEQKLHSAATEKEAQASKQTAVPVTKSATQAPAVEKEGSFSNLSDTAMLAQQVEPSAAAGNESKLSTSSSGDGQKKEEKAADKEKEKASANKTDGDH